MCNNSFFFIAFLSSFVYVNRKFSSREMFVSFPIDKDLRKSSRVQLSIQRILSIFLLFHMQRIIDFHQQEQTKKNERLPTSSNVFNLLD